MPLSITPNDLFDVAGAIRVGIRADAIREAFLWQGYSPTEPFDASGRVTFHVGEVARKLATAARKTAATDMTEHGVDSFIAAAQLLKLLYANERMERDNAASRAAYAAMKAGRAA